MEAGACPLEQILHSSVASGNIIRHNKQAIASHLLCSNGYFGPPPSSLLPLPLSSKLSNPSSSSSFRRNCLASILKHGARMGTITCSSSFAVGTILSDGLSTNLTTIRTFRPQLEHQRERTGKGGSRGGLSQLCEAIGQSGTGQPVPEEENPESTSEQVTPESPTRPPAESDPLEVDWRAFRARLVVTESILPSDETGTSGEKETDGLPLGTRWAHPILAPEAGCVLIATDKIDGQQSFERSVILLLSPGSSNPREGPYGLILNRPLSCRIKDIRPKDRTLVKFFGNCQVHHGGPLDEDMFLLLHGTPGVKGYREVIPGVYYGAANGLEEIMKGNHLLDYRFFFGYSGWGVEQLKKEIDAGLWFVAACSTDLITGHAAAGLWEEILLLMGGKYAELSKRPRRRHF